MLVKEDLAQTLMSTLGSKPYSKPLGPPECSSQGDCQLHPDPSPAFLWLALILIHLFIQNRAFSLFGELGNLKFIFKTITLEY